MNYKLKNVNGKVNFLLKTGKDFVKNQMAVASAQHIIDNGTLKESDRPGYPINVDDKWYFEGEPVGGERKPGKRGSRHENEV
jgi:hypothetical protein